ncbi:MAG: hypothetical protein ACYCXY_13455, partial [Acidimicrobiales bacterium]
MAHAVAVVGPGLDLPVPAAPTGGSVTAVERFVATRSGTCVWRCYSPCGSGPNLMGGPMSMKGWMEGTVRVLSRARRSNALAEGSTDLAPPAHQLAMVIDLRCCNGCKLCATACQTAHYLK